MSMSKLAALCSHLNNVTKARLALTSVPNTKLHTQLCLALQKEGLISSVVRHGPKPPPPHLLLNHPTIDGGVVSSEPVTQENVASRRLWLGLKYWQNEPVLGKMIPITKPKRKINLNTSELRRVLRGEYTNMVPGLRSPGECLFMLTNEGLMEARECVEKNVGGLVLVRVE